MNSNKKISNNNNYATKELLDLVEKEYEIERNKKQSFENRAGLILTLLGIVFIFALEKVELKNVFSMFSQTLSFMDLIKIISGISVYFFLIFTFLMILKVLNVVEQTNFNVECLNDELLKTNYSDVISKIIYTYRDIIIGHRQLSERRAKIFKKVLYGMLITIISILIYLIVI
ncbi:MAG: hypothetical protein NC181_00215 [Clostridium sp.]|nr:hypothetical protein [Clostridium sp.]MCM1443900.1 hypothetical protein [Candidatus Amulumruptor caecigallinarius]